MIQENFIRLYEKSFRENWELPAVSDYGTPTRYTFGQVAEEVARLHLLMAACGIREGEKVALVGKDSARWCIAYMAVITYGAVLVPILQDFNANDIQHILNHSDSELLFVSDRSWEGIDEERLPRLRAAFSLSDFGCLYERDGVGARAASEGLDEKMKEAYPKGFTRDDIRYARRGNEEVAVLNYTSGTTGFSKGVMLTGNNLAGNVTYAMTLDLMYRGDEELCFLPLAHAYSCAFNLLTPMAVGAHINILGKMPTPKILLKAFADIRPNLIITVPLILEKIYKKMILPEISRPAVRMALRVPGIRGLIYKKIRDRLTAALGGRFCEVIVGGAAMNEEVTEFLHRIGFRFTIGYGMTECAPLISYDNWRAYVPGSCGQILKDIMEVRIDSPDPLREVGEIQVRGENVMQGYYKNPEATASVFTPDGWLRTGDLGTIDANHRIYLRGRNKTMILSSNGQNIYPEEIESKLNNLPFVMESLVIEKGGKLVALVYPDYDTVDGAGLSHDDLPIVMEKNLADLNKLLAPYERVASIQLYPTEFEKTPKKSIKRYLYSNY